MHEVRRTDPEDAAADRGYSPITITARQDEYVGPGFRERSAISTGSDFLNYTGERKRRGAVICHSQVRGVGPPCEGHSRIRQAGERADGLAEAVVHLPSRPGAGQAHRSADRERVRDV